MSTYDALQKRADREARSVSVRYYEMRDALTAWLKGQLAQWLAPDKIAVVAGIIDRGELDYLLETGRLVVRESEKLAALRLIQEEYFERMKPIWAAEEDAEEAKRDAIYERYGLE